MSGTLPGSGSSNPPKYGEVAVGKAAARLPAAVGNATLRVRVTSLSTSDMVSPPATTSRCANVWVRVGAKGDSPHEQPDRGLRKGRWVQGRLIRIGRLDAEKYKFLDEPEVVLAAPRNSGTRIDLFTFMQRLPDASPKYPYPMEWDNVAALRISTFDHWWTKQIGNKTRNMAKKAEKKGVVVREVPFSHSLVQGIWKVYNECPVRQGRAFPHYGKDVGTVYKEEATFLDSSIFIGAFLGDQSDRFRQVSHG